MYYCFPLTELLNDKLNVRHLSHFNFLHATGTNAPAPHDGHIYVPSDLVCNIGCVVAKLG